MVFLKRARWWRWALVSPDGVAPSQIVGVSASVNLPLHHKVKKFSSQSSGTGSHGWSRKRGRKTVVWCGGGILRRRDPPPRQGSRRMVCARSKLWIPHVKISQIQPCRNQQSILRTAHTSMCAYHCAQPSYTIHQRMALYQRAIIIFRYNVPLISVCLWLTVWFVRS